MYCELFDPQVKNTKIQDIYSRFFYLISAAQRLVDNVINAHLVAACILLKRRMMRWLMWRMLPSRLRCFWSSLLWWLLYECDAFNQESYWMSLYYWFVWSSCENQEFYYILEIILNQNNMNQPRVWRSEIRKICKIEFLFAFCNQKRYFTFFSFWLDKMIMSRK